MPGVLQRRGEDVNLWLCWGWRCLGERERPWRGLGLEDGYGQRGEREGGGGHGAAVARLLTSGRAGVVVAWAGGLVDGYGRRGERGARTWGGGGARGGA